MSKNNSLVFITTSSLDQETALEINKVLKKSLKRLAKEEIKINVDVTFSGVPLINRHIAEPIESVENIIDATRFDHESHLYDALGEKISTFSALHENEAPEKVVFVIVSGPDENSHVHDATSINNMLEDFQACYEFELIFVGYGEGAKTESQKIDVSDGDFIRVNTDELDSLQNEITFKIWGKLNPEKWDALMANLRDMSRSFRPILNFQNLFSISNPYDIVLKNAVEAINADMKRYTPKISMPPITIPPELTKSLNGLSYMEDTIKDFLKQVTDPISSIFSEIPNYEFYLDGSKSPDIMKLENTNQEAIKILEFEYTDNLFIVCDAKERTYAFNGNALQLPENVNVIHISITHIANNPKSIIKFTLNFCQNENFEPYVEITDVILEDVPNWELYKSLRSDQKHMAELLITYPITSYDILMTFDNKEFEIKEII